MWSFFTCLEKERDDSVNVDVWEMHKENVWWSFLWRELKCLLAIKQDKQCVAVRMEGTFGIE